MASRVYVSIGTKKGLFLLVSNPARTKFSLRGPYLEGAEVYTTAIDTRGRPTILAGVTSWFWGTKLMRSTDLGRSFKETKSAPVVAQLAKGKAERKLLNIWTIVPGAARKDLWCGVEPASLYHSPDMGDSWEPVNGLNKHKTASRWEPGKGGLCLHSIVPRGKRIHAAISAAGHFRSDDGGKTWAPRNQGVPAGFQPDIYPEFGQCVHRVVAHPACPDRLYMQNHGGFESCAMTGVLRSDDGGDSWRPITRGLPIDFGFPLVVSPHDPDTAFVVPLDEKIRACPKGAPAIYRTTNGGKSWKRLAKGFPKRDAYFTVLRDALDIDGCPKPGLYLGTTNGQVWASRDAGLSWKRIAESLPTVLSVKVAVVGEGA